MPIGLQEILALLIVACVVGFALYRRWRRTRIQGSGCTSCGDGDADRGEARVNFYRRER